MVGLSSPKVKLSIWASQLRLFLQSTDTSRGKFVSSCSRRLDSSDGLVPQTGVCFPPLATERAKWGKPRSKHPDACLGISVEGHTGWDFYLNTVNTDQWNRAGEEMGHEICTWTLLMEFSSFCSNRGWALLEWTGTLNFVFLVLGSSKPRL